jgi:phage repressor protein C with HTH and peptisase S24 domain
MALGSRLKQAMDFRDMTGAELARGSGVDEATISALVNRDSQRSIHAPALARTLRISLNWLLTGSGVMDQIVASEPEHLYDEKYVYVARFVASGGLGRGIHNAQHVEISGTHAFRRDWILKMGWRPEALAVIDAEGPSMAPTINDGDVVLINTDDIKIVSGHIYAIEDSENGTRIKRLHRQIRSRCGGERQ